LFIKGQQIATLGDSAVNGDYSPHLHFQVIKTWVLKWVITLVFVQKSNWISI
jgi:murein DD-endopeptidase MepM/ murein hydrolase activator NlpD